MGLFGQNQPTTSSFFIQENFGFPPYHSFSPSNACCPLSWWTLLGNGGVCLCPSLLRQTQDSGQTLRVGAPLTCPRPPILMEPDWASMVLMTFPERKATPLPGRKPACINESSSYSRLMADWYLHPHPTLLPQGRRHFRSS